MGGRLPPDGEIGLDRIGVDPECGQEGLVQRQHEGQVGPRRMAGHVNLPGIAAVFPDMPEHPSHRLRSIHRIIRILCPFSVQAVIDRCDGETLALQFFAYAFLSPGQRPSVEPDDRRELLYPSRVIKIQFAPFLAVGILLLRTDIRNILEQLIILG